MIVYCIYFNIDDLANVSTLLTYKPLRVLGKNAVGVIC